METFITKIYVKELRGGVRDLEIPLSENDHQHLIITGKNGSGKTSLLEEIKKFLSQIESENFEKYAENAQKKRLYDEKRQKGDGAFNIGDFAAVTHYLNQFGRTELYFSDNEIETKFKNGEYLLAYFGARRSTTNEDFYNPIGIEKIELQKKYGLEDQANFDFIQYAVNLQADRLFAREAKELDTVEKIDKWFEHFENQLKTIFNESSLELFFDRKTYNFAIIIDGKQPFLLNALSDGYSAILAIVSELLLRMEAHNIKAYDMEGIVLIDEIETHLHVELQKRILPFLIAFFPKIQFIVTTHSPFVLSSIANATICDLETKIITKDLTAYSYSALVESYFRANKYSEIVKEKIAEYEKLLIKANKTIEDTENIKSLQEYFASAKLVSKELRIKLNQIELQYL